MIEEETPQQEERTKKQECPRGAPPWLITFSDLVTLLLTFFVLLLSMSNMNETKFNAAAKSMKEAFGTSVEQSRIDYKIPVLPTAPITRYAPVPQQSSQKIHDEIKSRLEVMRLNNNVELVKKGANSIILRVKDSILFDSESDRLTTESYPILRSLADIIRPLPMDIRIEGHTDNTPISHNRYNNWDLSVTRAVAVLRYYTQSDMLPLDRMAAVGYGEGQPITANTDEESKAKNRRVDFLLTLQSQSIRRQPSDNIPF